MRKVMILVAKIALISVIIYQKAECQGGRMNKIQ